MLYIYIERERERDRDRERDRERYAIACLLAYTKLAPGHAPGGTDQKLCCDASLFRGISRKFQPGQLD